MARGRPQLTQRQKLNNKVRRLVQQIEVINTLLECTLEGESAAPSKLEVNEKFTKELESQIIK